MNKKNLMHVLMIAAIVASTFVAAMLTPIDAFAKTTESSSVINIAKVDYESRALLPESKMIADNEIPLAAAPADSNMNMTVWLILVTASVMMTGIVIFENLREKRSER